MINANELRIGNWIEAIADMGNYPMVIQPLHIEAARKNPGCGNPIPLTDKVLENFGFIKVTNLPEMYGNPIYKIQVGPNPANRFLMVCKQGPWFTHVAENDNIKSSANTGAIRFVHQLQNLYFVLTEGLELIAKKHLLLL